jgi:hypothetical protein
MRRLNKRLRPIYGAPNHSDSSQEKKKVQKPGETPCKKKQQDKKIVSKKTKRKKEINTGCNRLLDSNCVNSKY